MKIYLAHQISGSSFDEVVKYFEETRGELDDWDYDVYSPMTAKGYLRTEIEFKAHGYDNPVSTNHAIFERDKWMISQVDIVYVNLMGMSSTSIGCMMELAWASLLGKHTIVAMEQNNPHRHAFVLEAADIVFDDFESAMDYLEKLSYGEMRDRDWDT